MLPLGSKELCEPCGELVRLRSYVEDYVISIEVEEKIRSLLILSVAIGSDV
ncbi:unnamed protein product [Enterobius vermicularis]|uniref:Saposin B-type domain-containing protein n=1 Tax=Enterobius vermicularis TaxID=51028 RepID=A0A0N4VPL9_ENTVE|nr:unnamed protein product [Enterobius vermicularis]